MCHSAVMSKVDLEAAVRILADASHLRPDQKALLATALGDDEKEAAMAKATAEAEAEPVKTAADAKAKVDADAVKAEKKSKARKK